MILKERTHESQVDRALEVSIHIGLAILLVASCLLILRPFIPLIAWGIIIAVAAHPAFLKLQKVLGVRSGVAAVVFTSALLTVCILPTVLLAQNLVESIQTVTAHVRAGTAIIPPPPPTIGTWPIIGAPVQRIWMLASKDFTELLRTFSPQLKAALPAALSASAAVGINIMQLLLSIVVSGVLLANAPAALELTRALANRLFGEKGPEFQQLIGSTIRSVTFGILGVAVIQTVLAAAGFFVSGMPAASMWSVIFLVAAVLQLGGLVLIPAVVYMFAIASTTKAVLFLVWCVFVGVMDNVLKPMLLGRGVAIPVAVVFVGSIGGFLAMGIIGLFVGAVVLAVGYKLFLAWLSDSGPNHAGAATG